MKKLSRLFSALALILSHIMCTVVAYDYGRMLCAIEHEGFSAPASVSLLGAVPFIISIIICGVLAFTFYKKAKNEGGV